MCAVCRRSVSQVRTKTQDPNLLSLEFDGGECAFEAVQPRSPVRHRVERVGAARHEPVRVKASCARKRESRFALAIHVENTYWARCAVKVNNVKGTRRQIDRKR